MLLLLLVVVVEAVLLGGVDASVFHTADMDRSGEDTGRVVVVHT
jgi:hypothetical protein